MQLLRFLKRMHGTWKFQKMVLLDAYPIVVISGRFLFACAPNLPYEFLAFQFLSNMRKILQK